MRKSLLLTPLLLLLSHSASAFSPMAPPQPPDAADANAFTLDTYAKLRANKGNIVFSGTSLREALGIAYLGAQGDTESEMSTALHLDPDLAKSAAKAKAENADWITARGSADLTIANRLWTDRGFTMLPSFSGLAKDAYGSPAVQLDLLRDPEGSRGTINGWVSKETHEKIPQLFPEGALSGSVFVITNAVYFKGTWATAFDKSETFDEDFTSAKTTVRVPTMHETTSLGFREKDGVKLVELPYAKSDLAMDVILPNDAAGLPKLEEKLTPALLGSLTDALPRGKVHLSLPKTTFTWGGSMKEPLEGLGMKKAFSSAADFGGIVKGGGIQVSDVVQKAYIAVDEKGTEAAAATGVVMRETAVSIEPPPIEMKVDHPYLFVIRDRVRGRILFMGRVEDPKA
jgi:serpin B